MGWELRKKPVFGERPIPKIATPRQQTRMLKPREVPEVLRPPKPEAPPGHEYYWRDE
jgi:hypothetical protein